MLGRDARSAVDIAMFWSGTYSRKTLIKKREHRAYIYYHYYSLSLLFIIIVIIIIIIIIIII